MTNLVEYAHVYTDGDLWVVVETGMPEDAVQIGIGDTLREAYDLSESTPIQSTGPYGGAAAAIAWAHGQDWLSAPASLIAIDDAELLEED